jgi:UMF1 family MFS transporter
MFLLTPDYPAKRPVREALREGLSSSSNDQRVAAAEIARAFLLANMIYTDGLVSLFAFGGIYAAGTFGWHTIQIGTFGIMLAIAGAFGAGSAASSTIAGPKRVIAGSMLVLLLAWRRSFWSTRTRPVRQGRAARPGAPCSPARRSAPISCWAA